MFGSRAKGATAERDVAARLQGWWAQIEPGCRFAKTPLSGGWGGPGLRAGFSASGDLMTTAKRFPWTVEVKRREGWSWKTFLAGKPSPVWGWWRQAQTQADEMGIEPMLWFRKSREPWRVLVREDYARGLDVELFYPSWEWTGAGRLLWGRCWFDGIDADYGEYQPALLDSEILLAEAPSTFAMKVARATPGCWRRKA